MNLLQKSPPPQQHKSDIKGSEIMAKKTKINFTFAVFTLKKMQIRSIMTQCIKKVLAEEGIKAPCAINVLVTDDEGIRTINNASRGIDAPTDVLSYPMFQLEAGDYPENWKPYRDPGTKLVPLGDMCISLERATAQAEEFGHSLRREIGYLTIHSMLHLLGYDHLDEGPEKKKMRAREEYIAAKIPKMSRD